MAVDDLSAPLGQNPKTKGRRTLPAVAPQALVAGLSVFVVLVAGIAMFADLPFGGEPLMMPAIEFGASGKGSDATALGPPKRTASERPSSHDEAATGATATAAARGRMVTIVDGATGKRLEMLLPSPTEVKPTGPDQRTTSELRESDADR